MAGRQAHTAKRRRRFLFAASFAAGVAVLLLVPLPETGRPLIAALNLLHAPVFAALAVVIVGCRESERPTAMRLLLTWAGTVAFGALAEFLQPLVGRYGSLYDLTANVVGATAGVAWAAAGLRLAPVLRVVLRLGGVVLLLSAAWPPAAILVDVYRQSRERPVLASFEHRLELSRWSWRECRLARSRRHATDGAFSLRLQLLPGKYPGAALVWPPGDWSGYEELAFDATLEGESPLNLVVKVHDAAHDGRTEDRFNGRVSLRPGRQRIRIPLSEIAAAPEGRTMNLRQIAVLQFFTVRLERPRALYLDNIRLQIKR